MLKISFNLLSLRNWEKTGLRLTLLAAMAGCLQLANLSSLASVEVDETFPEGTGPDSVIRNIIPDGVGGWWITGPFTTWSGSEFINLTRLDPTGQIRAGFSGLDFPGVTLDTFPHAAVTRSDGTFARLNRELIFPLRFRIIRVETDGQIDHEFAATHPLLEGRQIVNHPLGILAFGPSLQLLRPDDSLDTRFERWQSNIGQFTHPNSRLIPFPDGSVMILSSSIAYDSLAITGFPDFALRLNPLAIARPDGSWDRGVELYVGMNNWTGQLFAGASDGSGGLWVGGALARVGRRRSLATLGTH